MKCWVMFSLLGLLEVCVTHRVRGKLAECVKVLVLAWCLAPAPYSGSDLLFSLLPPLHWAVTSLATSAAPCLSCLMELSSEYIIQPASYGAALALAKSIQLVSFLSSEIPGEIHLFKGLCPSVLVRLHTYRILHIYLYVSLFLDCHRKVECDPGRRSWFGGCCLQLNLHVVSPGSSLHRHVRCSRLHVYCHVCRSCGRGADGTDQCNPKCWAEHCSILPGQKKKNYCWF